MKIFNRKCLGCGKEINTFCPHKFYCGKQKTKTGCAYKRQRAKVKKWNEENMETMKLLFKERAKRIKAGFY